MPAVPISHAVHVFGPCLGRVRAQPPAANPIGKFTSAGRRLRSIVIYRSLQRMQLSSILLFRSVDVFVTQIKNQPLKTESGHH